MQIVAAAGEPFYGKTRNRHTASNEKGFTPAKK